MHRSVCMAKPSRSGAGMCEGVLEGLSGEKNYSTTNWISCADLRVRLRNRQPACTHPPSRHAEFISASPNAHAHFRATCCVCLTFSAPDHVLFAHSCGDIGGRRGIQNENENEERRRTAELRLSLHNSPFAHACRVNRSIVCAGRYNFQGLEQVCVWASLKV